MVMKCRACNAGGQYQDRKNLRWACTNKECSRYRGKIVSKDSFTVDHYELPSTGTTISENVLKSPWWKFW